jgi:hypothetical protein
VPVRERELPGDRQRGEAELRQDEDDVRQGSLSRPQTSEIIDVLDHTAQLLELRGMACGACNLAHFQAGE